MSLIENARGFVKGILLGEPESPAVRPGEPQRHRLLDGAVPDDESPDSFAELIEEWETQPNHR